jgi:hypothetical protein
VLNAALEFALVPTARVELRHAAARTVRAAVPRPAALPSLPARRVALSAALPQIQFPSTPQQLQ